MFTLLVGCPPFWHRKQMIMLRNIMEGKYSFMSPEWSDISGEFVVRMMSTNIRYTFFFAFLEDPKDLIRRCLMVDPEKRITVRDCLKHPFFNTVVSTPCSFFLTCFLYTFLLNQTQLSLFSQPNTILFHFLC